MRLEAHISFRAQAIAAFTLLAAASHAYAIGFGNARISPVLGQALDATVPVRVDPGETLPSNCVSAEVTYGESRVPSYSVSAFVETGAGGEPVVRVRTNAPINEPIVSVSVTLGCNNAITRKLVVFADPPVGNVAAQAPRVGSTGEVVGAAAAGSTTADGGGNAAANQASGQASPARAAENAGAGGRRRHATAGSTMLHPQRHRMAAAPAAAASRPAVTAKAPTGAVAKAKAPSPAAQPAPPGGPRLQLDAVETAAALTPNLKSADDLAQPAAQSASSSSRAAAAAIWRSLNTTPDDLQADRERLVKLEQSLIDLRKEITQSRESTSELRARLQQAEAERYNNPLVVLLGALSVVLAGGVAWLAWLRRNDRAQQVAWWESVQRERDVTSAPPPDTGPSVSSAMPLSTPTAFDPPAQPDVEPAVARPAVAVAPLSALADQNGAPRATSVEELIDLEQQAEFFLVLGQDEAAIDLLRSHIDQGGLMSPLPYLKLLEIHQRRGDRDEYERIRQGFNQQFNAYAPAWEEDLTHGRELEDYPGVMARLQQLWRLPSQVLQVLQSSLLRQGEGFGTFDLPAYRDLLFLYSIARDLTEHDDQGVDLLLPIGGGDAGAPSIFDTGNAPLSAFTPMTGSGPLTSTAPLTASGPLSEFASDATRPMPHHDTDIGHIDLDLPLSSGRSH